jgi:phosphoglucosamine mutase
VLIDKHSTGDGIISALQLIAFLVSNKVSLNKALKEFPMYPQELINIPFSEQFDADSQEIILLIDEANRMMEMRGRILIRPSGTQPIIRVMTEGPDCDLVLKSANFLAESIKTLYL